MTPAERPNHPAARLDHVVCDISLTPGDIPVATAGTETELIYHYTDAAGLLGIVTSRCLWASDVWYMNDAREAFYGLEAIERAWKGFAPTSDYEAKVRDAAIKRLADLHDIDEITNSYIACFSKRRDDLSQWRAYGRPRGYSIAFDRLALLRMCPQVERIGKPIYRQVNYQIADQDAVLVSGFRSMIAHVKAQGGSIALPDSAAWMCILDAQLPVPAFKHPAFCDEEEVRLQIYHDPKTGGAARADLKFRNGQMGLTPYVEIPICDPQTDNMGAIREIMVGPQHNQDEARRAVKQLLARYSGSRVDVKSSDVRLRP